MQLFFHGQDAHWRGSRACAPNDVNSVGHGRRTPPKAKSRSLGLIVPWQDGKRVHCKYLLLSHTKPWKSFLRLCMGQREVLTVRAFSVLSCIRYWNSMLWSTDSCQNKVSADQYHVIISLAQVLNSSRSHVFLLSWLLSNYWFLLLMWAQVR